MLTVVIALLGTSGIAQSDCGELLDHNQDSIIGVEDLVNLLSFSDSQLETRRILAGSRKSSIAHPIGLFSHRA